MAKFAIYNYNFARIIEPNEQTQLDFPGWAKVDVEESFKNRQQLLGELLQTDYKERFPFNNAKNKYYWHKQIVKPQDEVYVMRVANVTNVSITDANLTVKEYSDYRNCLVIIDNRPGIQRIAIEKKSKAFKETKIVSDILETTFCSLLRQYRLKVKLSAVYATNVFWNVVKEHPEGFKKVTFYFPHLNLERLAKASAKYLEGANRERITWNSDLKIAMEADEGGTLNIDPSNLNQRALVEVSSAAGSYIAMKPKSNQRVIKCGVNQFVERDINSEIFDTLTSNYQPIPGMGQSSMDQIKAFMKEIPDVFTDENK